MAECRLLSSTAACGSMEVMICCSMYVNETSWDWDSTGAAVVPTARTTAAAATIAGTLHLLTFPTSIVRMPEDCAFRSTAAGENLQPQNLYANSPGRTRLCCFRRCGTSVDRWPARSCHSTGWGERMRNDELASLVDALRTGTLSRREFLRRAAALGISLVAAQSLLSTFASRAEAAAGVPRRGGVLKAAFSADPAGFDPVRGPSGMSHVVIEQVYSTLMALDPDAKPYPELAESYHVSDGGLTYTFRLRRGEKFPNGNDLTAADVKFTFDRLRAPNSGYSYGAGRDNQERRCGRSPHRAVQTDEGDRTIPDLHGVPRFL